MTQSQTHSATRVLPKKTLGKCQYLLFGLLLMLVGSPIGDKLFGAIDRPNYVLYATELFVIVGGLIALGDNRRHTILAIIATLPTIATSALALTNDYVTTLHSGVSSLFFYGYLAVTLSRYISRRDRVTLDTTYGIVVFYMVAALVFTALYCAIELFQQAAYDPAAHKPFEQHAFYMDPSRFNTDEFLYGDLVYYSFVTQTTLGYGDITPTNELGKSVALVQATFGVFFIAIIVARFISEYRQEEEDPPGSDPRR